MVTAAVVQPGGGGLAHSAVFEYNDDVVAEFLRVRNVATVRR